MLIINNEIENVTINNEDELKRNAARILFDYYESLPDLSLSFVSPETIQELNRNYRDVDSVTDVLSFSSDGEIDPETGKEYLGDIIICMERAQLQAEKSGHPVENEISLLLIHGILHLLGYDHTTDAEQEEMWKLQDQYLTECNIKLGRRPGEDFEF